jgi:uncharacterized tellurite resistance protein B-like protein
VIVGIEPDEPMRAFLIHVVAAIANVWRAVRDRVRGIAPSLQTPGHGHDRLRRGLQQMLPSTAGAPIPVDVCTPIDPGMLNARFRIGRQPDGDSWQSTLIVEICGTIEAPDENHEVNLQISLSDVTDSAAPPLPVLNRPKHGPLQPSSHFMHYSEMGRLCNRTTVLEDWTTVAELQPSQFVLPRQGSRLLQSRVAITSKETGEQLASTTCVTTFEGIETGYLDIEDNIQRAKTLAVGLAFSVAAADNELPDSEVLVIHGWVRSNFGSMDASPAALQELDRALQKTTAFFRKGGKLNIQEICAEIVEIAPMVGRIEIMDLCLRVAGAKGQVSAAEMLLLKDLAGGLAIDRTRLRAMVEKILPVHMHASQDSEMILGVTEAMNKEETRQQLNREYAKWSSRVISSDPSIRRQADEMLNLIANARTQYVGVRQHSG